MVALERTLPLERSSVRSAHKLISPYIHLTPVLTSTTLSNLAPTPQAPEALTARAEPQRSITKSLLQMREFSTHWRLHSTRPIPCTAAIRRNVLEEWSQ